MLWRRLSHWSLDKFPGHGLDCLDGVPDRPSYPAGWEDEVVPASVRELDGVAVLDPRHSLGPVVTCPRGLVADGGRVAYLVPGRHGSGSYLSRHKYFVKIFRESTDLSHTVEVRLVPGHCLGVVSPGVEDHLAETVHCQVHLHWGLSPQQELSTGSI